MHLVVFQLIMKNVVDKNLTFIVQQSASGSTLANSNKPPVEAFSGCSYRVGRVAEQRRHYIDGKRSVKVRVSLSLLSG